MKRGEIWIVAGGKDYAGKLRPAVILQDDRFDMTDLVTLCAFTSDPTRHHCFAYASSRARKRPARRLPIGGGQNHDRARMKIGTLIGRLADEDIVRLNRASWCSWESPLRPTANTRSRRCIGNLRSEPTPKKCPEPGLQSELDGLDERVMPFAEGRRSCADYCRSK